MLTLRRSEDRGHFDHGWLDTYHTFSFADYRDRQFMGFRSLRVINEDRVAPGQGFGRHPHRDMEIITYVMSGELEHQDSLGNGAVIRPGDVQYMAAGSGIEHSEFNPSRNEPVHLMQIWIRPDRKGASPRYEQRRFPTLSEGGDLTLLASPDGRSRSIQINQDALVFATSLNKGQQVKYPVAGGRGAWLQVLRGRLDAGGTILHAGDGASLEGPEKLPLLALDASEFLLFDLA